MGKTVKKFVIYNCGTMLLLWFHITCTAQVQWTPVNANTPQTIRDMAFADNLTGYAVAGAEAGGQPRAVVLRTTDAGANWLTVYEDTALLSLNDLVVVNDSIFCFGTDAGNNNYRVAFHHNMGAFHKSPFPFVVCRPVYKDQKIWFMAGNTQGGLCTYANNQVDTLLPDVAYFDIRGQHVVAVNATEVYLSDDWGQGWTTRTFTTSPLSSFPYYGYYNGDTVLASISYPTTLFYSYDHGNAWNVRQVPNGLDLFFADGLNIYGLYMFGQHHRIYSSVNGGADWMMDSVQGEVHGFYFYGDLGFVFGKNGVIHKAVSSAGFKQSETMPRGIRVYPNPAKNLLHLETADVVVSNITLRDSTGKTVRHFHKDSKTLSLAGLVPGTYYLELVSGTRKWSEKVLVE